MARNQRAFFPAKRAAGDRVSGRTMKGEPPLSSYLPSASCRGDPLLCPSLALCAISHNFTVRRGWADTVDERGPLALATTVWKREGWQRPFFLPMRSCACQDALF